MRLTAAVALLFLTAACSESGPLNISPGMPAPAENAQAVRCVANVRAGTVECGGLGAVFSSGVRGDVSTVGGQNTNVTLTSSNVSYDSGTQIFGFDVTVKNLLPEALGTVDGSTPHADGVRVFFADNPVVTSGAGSISVNGDGVGTFTGSSQPYFQYNGVLRSDSTTAAKRWELEMPPTVGSFTFTLYVAAEAQPLIVINEILANPADNALYADSTGEYVEVYNRGRLPVNLKNFTFRDNSAATATVTGDLLVPSHGYALFVRSADKSRNGNLDADFAFASVVGTASTNLALSNSADRVVIKAPTGVTVDSVAYSSSTNGAARELKDPTLDNADVGGANWQTAVDTFYATTRGTPRRPNNGATGGGGAPGTARTISINPSVFTLAPLGTRLMSASVYDSVGTPTSTAVTWTSTDTTVATVSGTGLVTAKVDGSALIIGTIWNGKADSASVTVVTPSTSSVWLNHTAFGVPTGGPGDIIVLTKTEYVVGYSPTRGGPAWVSWDLNATHFGDAQRCDCFSPDGSLPAGVYQVVTGDYTGSGYSRGHMVMSEQRTQNDTENRATFLLTNVLPQLQDMNGGPWLQFEIYTNDLARVSNKEVYNVAGGIYGVSPATLNGAGKVQIPTHTWKVIVVMNRGQGLADVASANDIQVIAVNMPNQAGIQSNPWAGYKTTVDAIEAATGLDLLASLPDAIESAVEATVAP